MECAESPGSLLRTPVLTIKMYIYTNEEGEKEFQDRKNIRVKGIGLLILILRALVGTLV